MKHFDSYKNLCTEFYDLDKPEAPPKELAFYLNYAKEAKGKILEPMCGSGRFLIPIMEQDYHINGIDASSFMLDALRKKCERKNLVPLLYESLLQKAQLDHKYSLIIIPSGSFCLSNSPCQFRCKKDTDESLHILFNALLPSGKFVFEVEMENFRSKYETNYGIWRGRWVRKQDGSIIVLSTLPQYDKEAQIETTICRYELIQKNQTIQTEVEEVCLKFYKPGELDKILKKHGFGNIKKYKPYEFVEAEETDPTIIYECSKGDSFF